MPNKKTTPRLPCPACGFLVFNQKGKFEICPICQWEDDPAQQKCPHLDGGANLKCLFDHQKWVLRKFPLDQKKHGSIIRAKSWTPLAKRE